MVLGVYWRCVADIRTFFSRLFSEWITLPSLCFNLSTYLTICDRYQEIRTNKITYNKAKNWHNSCITNSTSCFYSYILYIHKKSRSYVLVTARCCIFYGMVECFVLLMLLKYACSFCVDLFKFLWLCWCKHWWVLTYSV